MVWWTQETKVKPNEIRAKRRFKGEKKAKGMRKISPKTAKSTKITRAIIATPPKINNYGFPYYAKINAINVKIIPHNLISDGNKISITIIGTWNHAR